MLSSSPQPSHPSSPPERVVMRQRWSDLLFLHWLVDPALLQRRLPAGLHVDLHEGEAYLGVIPFRMQKLRPAGLPAVPWLSWFHELNLRTYVRDAQGVPGVWFFSLDCNQPVAVELARSLFHLPYQHARLSFEYDAQTQTRIMQASRRGRPDSSQCYKYRPESPGMENYARAEPGSRDWFLTERYLLYSTDRKGRLYAGRLHHEPYRLQRAVVDSSSTALFGLEGFEIPAAAPCSELLARPVEVSVYPLRRQVL